MLSGFIRRCEKVKETIAGSLLRESLRQAEAAIEAKAHTRTYNIALQEQRPFMQRAGPTEWGNVDETERQFTATRIGRVLYPELNPYAFWRPQIARRELRWKAKAVVKRVKQLEKELAVERADPTKRKQFSAQQVIDQRFASFKMNRVVGQNTTLWDGFARLKIPPRNIVKLSRLMAITKSERALLDKLSDQSLALVVQRHCPECQKAFWVQNTAGRKQLSRCYACRTAAS